MNVSDLIRRLEQVYCECGDIEVVVLDGSNGQGDARSVNVFAIPNADSANVE